VNNVSIDSSRGINVSTANTGIATQTTQISVNATLNNSPLSP
jgi:hypothetical protein